jgi:hypothetical protein
MWRDGGRKQKTDLYGLSFWRRHWLNCKDRTVCQWRTPSWEPNRPLAKTRNSPRVIETGSSLLPTATCPYPEPDQSSPCLHPIFWRSILKLSSHLHLGLPSVTVYLYLKLVWRLIGKLHFLLSFKRFWRWYMIFWTTCFFGHHLKTEEDPFSETLWILEFYIFVFYILYYILFTLKDDGQSPKTKWFRKCISCVLRSVCPPR